LPVVLYGRETLSLALREGHRLKILEIKLLGRIFGQNKDEIIRGYRRLHNEKFHYVYSSPNIIRLIKSRRTRWAGHVARMGIRGLHIGFSWESQKERDH
jgi:hypothetical protein